jgi:adenosylhomocysteine nucleosidase
MKNSKMYFGVILAFVLLVTSLFGCSVFQPKNPEGFLDTKPRLAVESAFDSELEILLSKTTDKTEYIINGKTFTTGVLNGVDVVLFESGVSMVNAAENTQLLFDHFNVVALIFSGIAGGVNPNLNIGDVVIPAQWAEYQEMTFAREVKKNEFVLPFGGTPEFPNYGMMFPGSVTVNKEGNEPDVYDTIFWFPVSPELLSYTNNLSSTVTLAKCTPDNVCLTQQPIIKIGGNGVDGQTFVDNADFREYVWNTFQADSLSMETAAVAQVAYSNNVPFLGFRSLSDLAGGGEGENEIGTFFQLAADNSAAVVLAFIDNYREATQK